MSKPDRVTAALTKLLDNADPAVVATAAGKLTDLRIAKMGTEKSENKVGPLRDEIAALKKSLAIADASMAAVTAERDALAVQVAELRPLADRLPAAESELAELRAQFDMRVADLRDELVAEAQRHFWDAQRAENAATEKLREADNKVSASGWRELRATVADLLAKHSVPMPDFWATSATMPSAFWTLFGWSEAKARIYTAYKAGYKEPTEAFKAHAYRILTEGLPTFPMLVQQTENGPQPIYPEREQKPIADLGVRTECIREMCQRFNCLTEIQARVDERQADELGQHLRNTANSLQVQEQELSRLGYPAQSENHLLPPQKSPKANLLRQSVSLPTPSNPNQRKRLLQRSRRKTHPRSSARPRRSQLTNSRQAHLATKF